MLSQALGAGLGSRMGLRQLRNSSLRKLRVLLLARQAIPRGDNVGCPRPCHNLQPECCAVKWQHQLAAFALTGASNAAAEQ